MENYVSLQLNSFVLSLLLGILGGCLYDLLRLMRRTQRRLVHLLDGVYIAGALLVLFLFTLRHGEGELRLYMILAMALGAVGYFLLFSALLRPIWLFWLDAAAQWCALLWKPIACFIHYGKSFAHFSKKLFHFYFKCATINEYQWKCPLMSENDRREEAAPMAKNQKRRKKHGGVVAALLLLSGVVGMEIVHVYAQIDEARLQEEQLFQQLEDLKRQNAGLAEDLSRADDPEFIKELAREELGLAEQGERIFYDVND